MYTKNITKAVAAFSFIAALFFTGCQKENLQPGNVLSASVAEVSKASNYAASEADDAFDSEVKEIMSDMMKEMKKMEMTCDPDIDFAQMMIMHHEAGIKMSEAELTYGHEAEAKMLATEAIENDKASIERLEAFLASHPTPEPLPKKECKAYIMQMDKVMKAMMQCMMKFDTGDVDVDYAGRMICHHEGALAMARIELQWGNDAATKAEAQMIIDEQTMHIAELKEFINNHGMPAKKP